MAHILFIFLLRQKDINVCVVFSKPKPQCSSLTIVLALCEKYVGFGLQYKHLSLKDCHHWSKRTKRLSTWGQHFIFMVKPKEASPVSSQPSRAYVTAVANGLFNLWNFLSALHICSLSIFSFDCIPKDPDLLYNSEDR